MLAFSQPEMAWLADDEGEPYVMGAFIVSTDAGYPNRVPTEIRFPPDYPGSEPWAIQTPGLFPHIADRHFYANGRCCLWLPVQSPWHRRDQYAFRHFLEQLTFFYHRQLVMDANPGSAFPGLQWDHGAAGYLEYLIREWNLPPRAVRRILEGPPAADPCPCGSGKSFLRCHEPNANRFRRRAGRDMTTVITGVLRRVESQLETSVVPAQEGALQRAARALVGASK